MVAFARQPFTDSVRFMLYPVPVWFDGGEKDDRGYCPIEAGEDGKEGVANGVLSAPNINVPRIIETNNSELLFFKSLFLLNLLSLLETALQYNSA
jgi:hypothetical protein